MKSLEDIYIERTSTHLEKGINGIAKQVSRTYKQKLTVKTIGSGLRYVHVIVDYFIMMIIMMLLEFLPEGTGPFQAIYTLIVGLFVLLLLPGYYTIMEFKFQQTPGKMITNSVVINEFAEKPRFRVCLLRTMIRFVPFEGFSCFGTPSRGWHDRWTNTYVVPKDEVQKLKELIAKNNATSSV
jgi:uncharacterized RDD family membrane protein YckC